MNNSPAKTLKERERDKHLAHLLGITYEEWLQLHHSGLQEVTDSEEQIYKYYIRFHGENPVEILDKLDIDSHKTVYFSAREWEEEQANPT